MSFYKAFNNVFIQMVEDCILVFPQDNQFRLYKNAAELLSKFNPRKPCSVYKEYASMYKTQIINKDETFFLNEDYSKIDAVQQDEGDVLNFIYKMKTCWKQLSEDNKEKIWKYLNTLLVITDKIAV